MDLEKQWEQKNGGNYIQGLNQTETMENPLETDWGTMETPWAAMKT